MPSHHRHYAITLTTPRSWWRVSFFSCWIWRCICISWRSELDVKLTSCRHTPNQGFSWIVYLEQDPFPAVAQSAHFWVLEGFGRGWGGCWHVLGLARSLVDAMFSVRFHWMLTFLGLAHRWSSVWRRLDDQVVEVVCCCAFLPSCKLT